jgi:hypothetical protein
MPYSIEDTMEIYLLNNETGEECTFKVDFNYYYDEGRYHSAWEDSYPAEECLEVTWVENEENLPDWVTEEMIYSEVENNLHCY